MVNFILKFLTLIIYIFYMPSMIILFFTWLFTGIYYKMPVNYFMIWINDQQKQLTHNKLFQISTIVINLLIWVSIFKILFNEN